MHKKIILVSNDARLFETILKLIQTMNIVLPDEIVRVAYCDEALNTLPEKGSCILITDSYNAFPQHPDKTTSVVEMAEAAHQKNPECKVVLSAFDYWDIEEKPFDMLLDLKEKESIEIVLREYLKKNL